MSGGRNPPLDYQAAKEGAAVAVREDRRFLAVQGRAPGEMLAGLLTNSLPPVLDQDASGTRGKVVYSAILTPKGRMISDLRILRVENDGFLLDLPVVGLRGALAHFGKFLPPRLARVHDRSGDLALLTMAGPGVPGLLSTLWAELGWSGFPHEVEELAEGAELGVEIPGGAAVRLLGNGDLGVPAWDLLGPVQVVGEVRAGLDAEGAVPLTDDTREVLRVEAGRPAFGADMDEGTIPVEAGIQARAIDETKGCYTGQEVIVRIRDRGHVNRELKGLLFEDSSEGTFPPATGSQLYHRDRQKSVGQVTSSVWSPAFGGAAGLGYLRRGLEDGELVQVGRHDGPGARVRDLEEGGWLAR